MRREGEGWGGAVSGQASPGKDSEGKTAQNEILRGIGCSLLYYALSELIILSLN